MRGEQPQPRTFHTSSAAIGARLFVFGGGDKGAEPVKDQRLHVFDTGTSQLGDGALPLGCSHRAGIAELCLEMSPREWVAVPLLTSPCVCVLTGNSDPVAWMGSLGRALGILVCRISRVFFLMPMCSHF